MSELREMDVEDEGPVFFLLGENVRRYQRYRIDGLTKAEREEIRGLIEADEGDALIERFTAWRDQQLGLEVQIAGEEETVELDETRAVSLLDITDDAGNYLWEP